MGGLVAAVHAPGSCPHLLRPGGVLADNIVLEGRVSCALGVLTLGLWHDNSTRLSSTPPVSRHATMPLCALTSKARPSLFLGLLPDASGLSKGHFVNSSGKPHWRLPCLRTDRRPDARFAMDASKPRAARRQRQANRPRPKFTFASREARPARPGPARPNGSVFEKRRGKNGVDARGGYRSALRSSVSNRV